MSEVKWKNLEKIKGEFMEKNRRILKIGIVLVCVTFALNVVIYRCSELKEPIFLKHYYELNFYDGMAFRINYICNKNDMYKVAYVNFGEELEEYLYISTDDIKSTVIGNYKLNEIVFTLRNYNGEGIENFLEDNLILGEAEIQFSNGKAMNVDLGKIILKPKADTSDAIDMYMSSSSNDNTSRCEYRVNETVKIQSIESNEDDSEILEVTFNGKNIRDIAYPIVLEKGNIINIASKPKLSSNDIRKYDYYDINKSIKFIDRNGQEQTQRVLDLRYTPYFNYWDMLKVIKSKKQA